LGIIAVELLFIAGGVVFGLWSILQVLKVLAGILKMMYAEMVYQKNRSQILEDTAKERRDERQMGIFEDPTARYGRTGFTQEAPVLQAQRTEASTPQEGTGTGPTTYPGIDR